MRSLKAAGSPLLALIVCSDLGVRSDTITCQSPVGGKRRGGNWEKRNGQISCVTVKASKLPHVIGYYVKSVPPDSPFVLSLIVHRD
ncbi:hypothetical protein FQA47_022462 [Oryzias melastigma]|uniref:Secreted protein n=1 Tax=Oryzias melastigma TaxID=30732 RepID=A0A834BTD1_ORYME|nr:hypothetical protein FQA47_022462 [Oryzias melastigma]